MRGRWPRRETTALTERSIAYFSMEIFLDPGMPTYSGGLGVLAGDTLRSAADLDVPMVAVSLLYRAGHFYQRLDADGRQHEEPVRWIVDRFVTELPGRVTVTIAGRAVHLRAWQYEVRGCGGGRVPVYLLDADLPENAEADRRLTHHLYGGDERYRLAQEIILGIGGVRMLRALGHTRLRRFHMNEGHASLLTLELLEEEAARAGRGAITHDDIEAVRARCIFTTHTPVPAGHDQFPMDLVAEVLGPGHPVIDLQDVLCVDVLGRVVQHRLGIPATMRELVQPGVTLNMTYLALNLSRYVNGVAKRHGEVSRMMFADYAIDSITNGVHVATWAAPPFRRLFDRHIPGWREDNFSLRYAVGMPAEEVWQAHLEAKRELIGLVNRHTNAGMDERVLTLGFARRAAAYKRADLVFTDLERVKRIASTAGPIQLVFGGKAHPRDDEGKAMIQRVVGAAAALGRDVPVAYLENYDVDMARTMTAGVDVWLNSPLPPNEASGTSGMKAALNGVPSLSILDGWWIEGHIEGITGWAFGAAGPRTDPARARADDAASLYDALEREVVPLYYGDRRRFVAIMRQAIALNGSFFNTQRMVQQYFVKAYFA